ncbi:MAG: hypothetical protein RMN51_08415 [Verrucomicrobiota bacterium]|nr:hypothetical protein [Limisphaera sp.]MDW8382112.1 hypothetical protein [Verrucomicrobiota bacterium]
MHTSEKQIPIWFFIGLVLAVYGFLILLSGLHEMLWPPPEDQRVALWHLHAPVWWGALMLIVGLFYSWRFRPRGGETLTGRA